MKTNENYLFEILIIDRLHESEISNVNSISMGLAYSEKLWKKPEIKETSDGPYIEDKSLNLNLQVKKVDAQDAAFLITLSSTNFEKIETFRIPLLLHIENNLHFDTVKVINDGVSATLGQVMHPLIKNIENSLRSYLAKHHNKKSGLGWWESVASDEVAKKVAERKKSKTAFTGLIDTDILLTKCDELGEFASSAFPSKSFQTKWEKLVEIKERIAYNDLFEVKDFESVNKIVDELAEVIKKAESKLGNLKIASLATSSKPKKTLKKTVTKSVTTKRKPAAKKKPASTNNSQPTAIRKEKNITDAPKNVEKPTLTTIKSPEKKSDAIEQKHSEPIVKKSEPEVKETPKKKVLSGFEMISEKDLLAELKAFESNQQGTINLRSFVMDVLGEKGYATGPAYSLTKNLDEKGLVEIYDTKDSDGLIVKAVRTN